MRRYDGDVTPKTRLGLDDDVVRGAFGELELDLPQYDCEDFRTDGLGEKRTQRTLCNLRRLVEEAGVDPCSCYLTNSVLALAGTDRMTGNEKVYAQHPKYLQRCAAFHEEWISRNTPRLVVLMGRPNVETYCRHVFHSIFPILKTCWRGLHDAAPQG